MLKPNFQCDGIRRWGLWGLIRSWGQSLHEWDEEPHKRDRREFPQSFRHMKTQHGSGHLWTRNQAFTRYWICQCFDFGLCTSRIVRNIFLPFISHSVYSILLEQPEQTKKIFYPLCVSKFTYFLTLISQNHHRMLF